MARSEILSPLIDGIPISDVSGFAFDFPRPGSGPVRPLEWLCGNALGADGRPTSPWDYFPFARNPGQCR